MYRFNFDVDKYWGLQGQSKNVVRNGFGMTLFNNFNLINSVKEQRPASLAHIKDKQFMIGSFYNKIYGYLNFFPHFVVLTEIALASFKYKNIINPCKQSFSYSHYKTNSKFNSNR